MPQTVNLSDVEAQIEHMRSTLASDASRNDQRGANARAMIAILPGAIRWSASEFNSVTPFPEVMIALASLVSNMLASEIANVEVDDDGAVEAINTFLRMVAAGSHQILTGPRSPERSAIIKSSEAGNA